MRNTRFCSLEHRFVWRKLFFACLVSVWVPNHCLQVQASDTSKRKISWRVPSSVKWSHELIDAASNTQIIARSETKIYCWKRSINLYFYILYLVILTHITMLPRFIGFLRRYCEGNSRSCVLKVYLEIQSYILTREKYWVLSIKYKNCLPNRYFIL
jgi:hypothetical protein